MLSGDGDGNENVDLICKKTTLQVQHTFFEYFFAIDLHDYSVKRPETS